MGLAAIVLYESAISFGEPRSAVSDPIEFLMEWSGVLVIPSAVMLLLGHRTRLATLLTWLVYTVPIRDQLLVSEGRVFLGNYILALMLFWSLFLPLGATWSVDARQGREGIHRFLSVASAGILIQVFIIYFSAGVTRDMGEWVFEATALQTILGETRFGSDLGASLTQFPVILAAMSVATIALELIGSVLVFVPGKRLNQRRAILVVLFVLLHVGMFLFMDIGIFPFVMVTVWLLFLPSSAWDRLTRRRPWDVEVAVESRPWYTFGAVVALGYVAVSNAVTWLYFPNLEGWQATYQLVGRYLLLYQQWAMFAVPSSLV